MQARKLLQIADKVNCVSRNSMNDIFINLGMDHLISLAP